MDELRKALETFALRNAKGDVSDAVLEKACEAYKARSEFVDDYEYSLYVTKSLYDHLHGVEQDPDIVKAIMPGQTKVVNGVVYIWTLTPNAKTTYDWRVYKNPQGIPVGKGAFRSKVMLAQQEKEVNEMFPADPSQLTFVQKLGGSTGAVLMKDAKGREFVVKSSKNTNRGHVAAEYYAAQVYSLLGLDTPDYELYDDGTDLTLISNYMRGMSEPQVKDYDAMAKGFVVDAFLANWDVYQNDNCWGAIDDDGNPAYMKFDDFMDNHLRGWVTANGGTITEKGNGTGDYVIKMPNTAERFVFSRYRYENDAIKRKNGFARPYNYPVRQFKEWIMREHYGKIEDAVKEAVNNLGDEIKRLQGEQRKAYTVYQDKRDAVSKLYLSSVGDPDKDIYAAIYKSVHEGHDKEPLGVYAALKGYDALIQPNGNYCGNSFMIVLNRSKIITRK